MAELEQCTAEQVVDSVEAVTLAGRTCTAQEIADFVNHPLTTIERATSVAVKLGLLTQNGNDFASAETYDRYFAEASESHRIDVLRFALEAYPPYRFFKQRLAFHGDPQRAGRETKLRYEFTNHEAEVLATLMSLGQYTGSLSYSRDSGYTVTTSEVVDEFLRAAETVSLAAASIEDFIRERLGPETYAYVQDEDDDIITHLRGAFSRMADDELDAGTVVLLGNACENFLIKLANDAAPAVNLQGANGVNAKANRLRTAEVIAEKHLGYTGFIGQLRNAADHGIDVDINLDWALTPEAVKLGCFLLLAGMRSMVALVGGSAEF